MTFDPERRSDLDVNDPIRRRMADGDGVGWVPAVLLVRCLWASCMWRSAVP